MINDTRIQHEIDLGISWHKDHLPSVMTIPRISKSAAIKMADLYRLIDDLVAENKALREERDAHDRMLAGFKSYLEGVGYDVAFWKEKFEDLRNENSS